MDSMDEVKQILEEWGFAEYVTSFEDEGIDIEAFDLLDSSMIKSLFPKASVRLQFQKSRLQIEYSCNMFSIQNQNQAILHLSQVSAILNPRQTAYLRKKTGHNSDQLQILCQDSFLESVKNCDLAVFKNLNIKTLYQNHFLNNFNVSYISSNSFFENKNGFAESDLKSGEIPTIFVKNNKKVQTSLGFYSKLVYSLLRKNDFTINVQVRGFKTVRSIDAAKSRNPSMSSRFRGVFGMDKSEAPVSPLEKKESVEPTATTDRFKQMLLKNDTMTTEKEKQQMKIAFAEGYLLGSNPKQSKTSKYLRVVQQLLTIVIFLAIVISLVASAGGSMFRIQLGNQVEVDPEDIHVTFNDVKGADEAKQELKDVVEFLKNPDKFSSLGGKLPKGVLLVGPPGTGKTLLARAVAGEAGVPFFHAAGPEFDEILVGQGARRVRDLFKAAKEKSPCVIFIDEIDSVGAKRTNSVLHPYANQTINQLLSEMDGFHQNEGVIVLGATNRREDLDTALLRPGRFDVEVSVPTPDFTGRKEILVLYLSKILAKGIDVDMLARGTTGFTGADLENMVNQAALRAAIDEAEWVSMKYLEQARDKVIMGPQRKCRIPDEEANAITAYHEGGHAIVAYFTKYSHPLHKVTIIPRGPSLGHTAYIPEKERYHVTKAQLLAMMDTMMGGRAAEELIFGPEKITSGASSDLKQATAIATHMVRDWGMSEKVGLRTTITENPRSSEVQGPAMTEIIDNEIKRIMTESYERAKHILKVHNKEHKAIAEALLKYETLDADDIKAIMADKPPELKS